MRRNVSGQYVGAQLISKTDGSAVTSGTTTVYVTGDAGTQAAGSVGSGACTHEGYGYWTYAPAQAETNYTQVAFTFVNTSACNTTIQIYPIAYDASGQMTGVSLAADQAVNTTKFGGTTVTGRDLGASVLLSSGTGTGQVSLSSGAVTVGTNNDKTNYSIADATSDAVIADAVWNAATATYGSAGTYGEKLEAQNTASVTVTTNNDKTGYSISGTKTTLDALNDVSTAQVNAEVDTALVDIGLDHLVSASVTGTDITDNSIIAKMVSSSATADWDTFVNTDDALQAISESGGGGPTAAQIADAVWDEAQADHVAAGSFGIVASEVADILTDTNSLNDTKIPDTISLANINTQVDTALTDIHLDHLLAADYDPAAKPGTATALLNELVENDAGVSRFTANALEQAPDTITGLTVSTVSDKAGYSLADSTSDAVIADAVWNAATATYGSAGSYGEKLEAQNTSSVTVTTNNDKTGYSISGTKTTLDALNDVSTAQVNTEADTALSDFFTSSAKLVDDIWDEVLTGATHNVASSSGRRLRTASGGQIDSGTAQAGGSDTITLATSASTTTGLYVGCAIVIDGGTGIGQSRYIIGYTSGRVATVARPWTTAPDGTSTYVLYADNQIDFLQLGLAAAGANDSITLDANASATDNIYNGQSIRIFAGAGKYQLRCITAYNGTTKVATVDRNWNTNPDATSYYAVLGIVNNLLPDQAFDLTGNITGNLSGTIGSLNTQAKADVNAEVLDALATDTYAEPGQGAPAATATLAAKINYLYKAWRNKATQTATTYSLYDDAGTTVDQKSTVSDDGTTATKGEIASGP